MNQQQQQPKHRLGDHLFERDDTWDVDIHVDEPGNDYKGRLMLAAGSSRLGAWKAAIERLTVLLALAKNESAKLEKGGD